MALRVHLRQRFWCSVKNSADSVKIAYFKYLLEFGQIARLTKNHEEARFTILLSATVTKLKWKLIYTKSLSRWPCVSMVGLSRSFAWTSSVWMCRFRVFHDWSFFGSTFKTWPNDEKHCHHLHHPFLYINHYIENSATSEENKKIMEIPKSLTTWWTVSGTLSCPFRSIHVGKCISLSCEPNKFLVNEHYKLELYACMLHITCFQKYPVKWVWISKPNYLRPFCGLRKRGASQSRRPSGVASRLGSPSGSACEFARSGFRNRRTANRPRVISI